MRWQRSAGIAFTRLSVALVLLIACESGIAANCGAALRATELGRLANALSRANQRLLKDAADPGSGITAGGETRSPGTDVERLDSGVILAMRMQAAVDRLAVLTQLRDLMRQSEDRLIVQEAVASFALRAAELSTSTVMRLSESIGLRSDTGAIVDIRRVRELAHQISGLIERCKWAAQ